ncbi:MAG TPA: outer membrane protein assembly factor BamD [Pyrinomonadaceae bacterium]|nr:outer membrane protein assembly factor BamD [Pyrinomonadaceae bacterium]
MKKAVLMIGLCAVALVCAGAEARAQGGVGRGPDPTTVRDADMEKDSLHNLEVARQYFKLKKAYFASLKRVEEIIAGNPNFAKIDEALYIAGMSSLYLSKNQGKQKVESLPEKRRLTPEKYREEARLYLSQLVNDHPDSDFNRQAQDALRELGGPIPKTQ